MFANVYQGSRVLITGHTGFKGSWLTTWLLRLGADVIGVSNSVTTNPAMFEVLSLEDKVKHIHQDIRDLEGLREIIVQEKPDFIFHLAAQAIVSYSYENPTETMSTNIIGTMNVLESLRNINRKCVAVIITSDKCYDNSEWVWGYRETDKLGGRDIYSGSKGAAEIVINSYLHSFFADKHPVKIGIGRAGNVIGGGDWAKDRIVADCMRAWNNGLSVEIRCPNATRPWQHVLEPLSGYLSLGQSLATGESVHGEAFNFGPKSEQNNTVLELIEELGEPWKVRNVDYLYRIVDNVAFNEASLLKLNCDKALAMLKWEANLSYLENINLVRDWYNSYYQKENNSMFSFTQDQIAWYEDQARERHRVWVA